MRRLAFVSACLLLFAAPVAAEPIETTIVSVPVHLVERAGLDAVFAQFGESLALSARQHGVSDGRFLAVWEGAARDAFDSGGLDARLGAGLAEVLDNRAIGSIEGFLGSPLGARIAALEASVQGLTQTEQIAVIAKGQALLLGAGAARRGSIEEIYALSNAEMTFAVMAESLRGVALGLHLAGHGEIAVPWDEIDAVVGGEMAGLRASLRDASLGVMAYTFSTLSDDEIDAYLGYLRAPETQTFQAVAAMVVSAAIEEAMRALSEEVARRLGAVAI